MNMKEMRRWQSGWLKQIAEKRGLQENASILVRERSMLKDCSYITRERRTGIVLKLYPHHFYCLMEDGTKESFRYNEFLGYESRLVRLKNSAEGKMTDKELNQMEKASCYGRFFATRAEGFEPPHRLPGLSDFESELFNHLSTPPCNLYILAESIKKSNQIQRMGHNLDVFALTATVKCC